MWSTSEEHLRDRDYTSTWALNSVLSYTGANIQRVPSSPAIQLVHFVDIGGVRWQSEPTFSSEKEQMRHCLMPTVCKQGSKCEHPHRGSWAPDTG